jgi:hypothetical protein
MLLPDWAVRDCLESKQNEKKILLAFWSDQSFIINNVVKQLSLYFIFISTIMTDVI